MAIISSEKLLGGQGVGFSHRTELDANYTLSTVECYTPFKL